ncbi:MAG: hypothetical protein COZ91_02440 [Candidatus Nealsonbacteria bacterium CG_4_8_14_3_um_filter_39_7]|uniref:Uncharacterized protein n=1 Tax=Candidatus Nealsonbacteria bacterium CG23_combo_of_CG06-09_8_20_14_all_39_17 TaxID=1974722 RepID=A0A2G9YUM3_9BACT|nr:MAG: hypothetical protein COX37_01335 [Candidatus Nealsonbacteria bacterium CG23_combo_of_CG06-09_8_20_14_all_39_17]PIU44020.1 MAG: hypothetical protein COS96_01320 [Candidatus Nealsonbacteria bacterium CG07_land_8_20_14_0_80_39_13]PIW91066.1 MAG: hypothetical protein COZ91_02440 [Candidatus Nealsonbacteria bacterium CG_4_8_14_3_um_filter_39_7]
MVEIFIIISIASLAVIAGFLFLNKRIKPEVEISRLATFAFVLVLLGIFFGDNRLFGYSFMGAGVILATIDLIKNLINKKSLKK